MFRGGVQLIINVVINFNAHNNCLSLCKNILANIVLFIMSPFFVIVVFLKRYFFFAFFLIDVVFDLIAFSRKNIYICYSSYDCFKCRPLLYVTLAVLLLI